jgi:putative transcriptional regulator
MPTIGNSTKTTTVLQEIGDRLRSYRLQQNQSIEHLSAKTGVGSRTVRRAESGEGLTLKNMIKLLRGLGRLSALDSFLEPVNISPIEIAKLHGKQRQKARTPKQVDGRP